MQLGRLARIPLHVHGSVALLFLGFIAWSMFSLGLRGLPIGLVLGVGIFASIVLHELGHALMARTFGVGTQHITIYPFGGVAALDREAESAWEEFLIAFAGPGVNLVLFAGMGVLHGATGWRWLLVLSAMNLAMAVFNLLPAYPMDGGRILRAALATQVGWFRASQLAMQLGTGFAWLFILGGVGFRSLSLGLTGALLLAALRSERQRVAWLWTYSRDRAGYRKNGR